MGGGRKEGSTGIVRKTRTHTLGVVGKKPKLTYGSDGVLGWFGNPEAMVTMCQLAMAIIPKPCGTPIMVVYRRAIIR